MFNRKVLSQLLKEFCLPFVVALMWATFGGGGGIQSLTVPGWIARFSTAFFFVSWLGSQLFRVNKQVKTESSLAGIGARLDDVVVGLEASAKEVASWATGGDTYAHVSPIMNNPNAENMPHIVMTSGRYPLFGLQLRAVDIDALALANGNVTAIRAAEHNFHVGNVSGNFAFMNAVTLPLGEAQAGAIKRFNLFWSARNGTWFQQLRFHHDGERWHFATKVTRAVGPNEMELLEESVPDNFPNREAIDWG